MTTLLRPLVQDFNHVMSRMSEHAKNEALLPSSGEENEEKSPSELCAETLNYAMGYARFVWEYKYLLLNLSVLLKSIRSLLCKTY